MATYSAFFSSGLNAPRALSPDAPMDCDGSDVVERRGTPGADSTNTHSQSQHSQGYSKSRSRSSSINSNGGGTGRTLRKRRSSLTLGSTNPTLSAIKSPTRAAGTAFKHMAAMSLSNTAGGASSADAQGQTGIKGRLRSGSLGGVLRRSSTRLPPPPPPSAPLPPLPPLSSMFPTSAPPTKSSFGPLRVPGQGEDSTPKFSHLGLPPTLPHRTHSYQAATSLAEAKSSLLTPPGPQRSYSYQGTMNTSYYNPSPSSPILPSSPMRPDSPIHPSGDVTHVPLRTPEKTHLLNLPRSSVAELSTPERERWGRARAYSVENGYRIHEEVEL